MADNHYRKRQNRNETVGSAGRPTFDPASIGSGGRLALSAIAEALRSSGVEGPLGPWVFGESVVIDVAREALGQAVVDALVDDGLAHCRDDRVDLGVGFALVGRIVAAVPREVDRVDGIYLGADSSYLIEAAVRLAPAGGIAADLGTGTGLLAAILCERYTFVVATDLLPRVAAAARLTIDMNRYPGGHSAVVAVCDVADALRPGRFDLVVGNAPWVPSTRTDEDFRIFAAGGVHGVELAERFLSQSAALLRPGGVSIILALDVTLSDGRQPLREVCQRLHAEGFLTAVLSTPINERWPTLAFNMRERQPAITDALHVAVVTASPAAGKAAPAVLVAAQALGRQWCGVNRQTYGAVD